MKTLRIMTMLLFVLALGVGNVFANSMTDNSGGSAIVPMLPWAYNSSFDKSLAPVKIDITAGTYTYQNAFHYVPSTIGSEKATSVPMYCLSNWQCVFK